MDGASANAFAAIVGAERERVLAAGDAEIVPVEIVRAGFVGDPLAFGVPEWACLEANYFEACARKSLQKNATCRTHANDGVVDEVGILEAARRQCDLLHGPEELDVVRFGFAR